MTFDSRQTCSGRQRKKESFLTPVKQKKRKRFKMKKKQSPNKASRESQIAKTQRGSHEAINLKRCIEPAVLALRKVSNMDRPPTPYSEVENGRESEQILGPVFVPNKFMNGCQSYTQYARAMPSASWASNRSPVISKMEAKPSNLAEVYRTSKVDVTLSLPAVDIRPPLKLSNEELKTTRRASFLPKIDGNSKTTNSGSFQNVVVSDYTLKRSPQTSSETIKLPPAKIRNGNITCTGKNSPLLCSLDKNASPEDVVTTGIVPKPPSVSCTKDRSNFRRKSKRRKDEERNN